MNYNSTAKVSHRAVGETLYAVAAHALYTEPMTKIIDLRQRRFLEVVKDRIAQIIQALERGDVQCEFVLGKRRLSDGRVMKLKLTGFVPSQFPQRVINEEGRFLLSICHLRCGEPNLTDTVRWRTARNDPFLPLDTHHLNVQYSALSRHFRGFRYCEKAKPKSWPHVARMPFCSDTLRPGRA